MHVKPCQAIADIVILLRLRAASHSVHATLWLFTVFVVMMPRSEEKWHFIFTSDVVFEITPSDY